MRLDYFFVYFPLCFAQNSDINSLLQVAVQPPPPAPGIIVWSQGRSATGSLIFSLDSAFHYPPCGKSNFATFQDEAPSKKLLKDCIQKGQRLMKVAPVYLHKHGGALQRPKDFLQAAFEAGFRILVGSFRENQLARDLSSFEWQSRQRHRKNKHQNMTVQSVLGYPGMIKHYERKRAHYTEALEAAKKMGYTIVPSSFPELISDTCTTVRRTIEAVKSIDPSQSFSECHAKVAHILDSESPFNVDLKSKAYSKVASIIRDELSGTPYEWMLDRDANDWPQGTQPPVPVPTWHVHKLIKRQDSR